MSTTKRESVSHKTLMKKIGVLVVLILTWTNTGTSVIPSDTELKSELKAPACYTCPGGYP